MILRGIKGERVSAQSANDVIQSKLRLFRLALLRLRRVIERAEILRRGHVDLFAGQQVLDGQDLWARVFRGGQGAGFGRSRLRCRRNTDSSVPGRSCGPRKSPFFLRAQGYPPPTPVQAASPSRLSYSCPFVCIRGQPPGVPPLFHPCSSVFICSSPSSPPLRVFASFVVSFAALRAAAQPLHRIEQPLIGLVLPQHNPAASSSPGRGACSADGGGDCGRPGAGARSVASLPCACRIR